jgi:hypothetical protein
LNPLAVALLAVLEVQAPPGRTAYSVEPADDGKFSSFYGTTVRRESPEAGRARYTDIVEVAVEQVDFVLAESGSKIFTRTELAALTTAVMIQESGVREDVQVGRGRHGKADDVGGEGRGPGNEACLMQAHPVIAWKYSDAPKALKLAAEKGDRKAREAIARTLLGRDRAALARCFRVGIRMLVHGARWCSGQKSRGAPDWSAVAMFVSGTSCTTSQHGKTAARVNLARRIYWRIAGREKKS